MNLLRQLYTISSKSGNEGRIKSFIVEYLSTISLSVRTDEIGNLYITKGVADVYPCVAAHLDEIHRSCEREVVIEEDKIFTVDRLWNKVGCGADDKNGLWIILNLLCSEAILKAVLFVQEERTGDIAGCRGARNCDLNFFDDVQYVIECDRKGGSDIVTIGKDDIILCHSDFFPKDLLTSYGYELVKGGKTDVVELKRRGLEIPVCNISCGYYNSHKNTEYTKIPDLMKCLDFVREFLAY